MIKLHNFPIQRILKSGAGYRPPHNNYCVECAYYEFQLEEEPFARCKKHEFEIESRGTCNDWEKKYND